MRRALSDLDKPAWSTGPCDLCRRRRNCYHGKCVPCRQPADRRDLVEAGVPCGSADALSLLARKLVGLGNRPRAIEDAISVVHPRLMTNIRVLSDGTLRLRSRRYFWMRRGDWTPVERA